MLGQASLGLHLQDGTQTGLTASEDHFWKVPEGPEVGRKELAQPLAMTKGCVSDAPFPNPASLKLHTAGRWAGTSEDMDAERGVSSKVLKLQLRLTALIKAIQGTVLPVLWLRRQASNAESMGSVPGGGNKIPYATLQ